MFIKIGKEAIINISEIVSVTKGFSEESLEISLKHGEDNVVKIYGQGQTKAARIEDTEKTYNFIWDIVSKHSQAVKE
jgi:hypothetical protein